MIKKYRCRHSAFSFYVDVNGRAQRVEFFSQNYAGNGSELLVADEALQAAIESSEQFRFGVVTLLPMPAEATAPAAKPNGGRKAGAPKDAAKVQAEIAAGSETLQPALIE